jgi:hypothetical protein
MKLSPALLLSLSLSLALIGQAQDPKPTTSKSEGKGSPSSTNTKGTGGKVKPAPVSSLDALFKLVEIGRTHEGVRYPVLENGVMTSMVDSKRMTRLDENLLELEDAVIDQRSGDPIKFFLERGTFNKQTDQLLSGQPTRIEGKTYQIEGDTMSYDRKNNVARLDGRVRMVIYQTKAAAPTATQPEPAPTEPKPAPKPVPTEKK